MIKVKLYGESIKIYSIKIREDAVEQFMSIADALNEPLNIALMNPYFYRKLNQETVKTVKDLGAIKMKGLINNKHSQIEIWSDQRRKLKLTAQQLFTQETLFPLYNTSLSDMMLNAMPSGYYYEEREFGFLGSYEIDTTNFKIEELKFGLLRLTKESEYIEMVNHIKYQEKKLQLRNSKAVLRYYWCFYSE